MYGAIARAIQFFAANTPRPLMALAWGPPALAWATACLWFAGRLKRHKGLRTGYTRKIFHFSIFVTVAILQAAFGTPAVCLFGGATSLVVFYAILRGKGHLLYEAIAREKDAPHESYYIIIPYLATLLGGLAGNILFGAPAIFGYLVTGLGDAVGEPVGTRFGRHTYAVPSLRGVRAVRSLEGSAAVFVASFFALMLGLLLSPAATPPIRMAGWMLGIAIVCTLVEAVSPHGWDNASLQLTPTCLVALLLGSLPA